jgi:hypothetical protein
MRKVQAADLLDLGAYEEIRERFRGRIIEAKKHRRLQVGAHLTFIWENRDTVLFQIQEMLRTERISAQSAIQHELDTYNELVPGAGELSSTLMIEYDDPAARRIALERFASLRQEVALHIGARVVPGVFYDQPGEEPDRLPAVNYVRFPVGDVAQELLNADVKAELVVSNTHYHERAALPGGMRRALADDLRDS